MILTIAIISGVMYLIYLLSILLSKQDDGSSTALCAFGAILVLSSWYLNVVTGITFLVIVVVFTLLAIAIILEN